MPRRKAGQGRVTELGPGRFWARITVDGKPRSLGVYATALEAEEALTAAPNARDAEALPSRGLTFSALARRVLDQREEDGVRSVKSERNRYRCHLAKCDIAEVHVANVTPWHITQLARSLARKEAKDKRGKRKISKGTVRRCMALVRTVFDEAIPRAIRPDNPCAGLKLRTAETTKTEEAWTYLKPAEQEAIRTCGAIPEFARLLLLFALGTGLRQGEQWNLELRDLHVEDKDPHVTVRFGSRGQAPKNGKTRKVPLFGVGLYAAKRWLEILPAYAPENPLGLVFPTVTGCRRGGGAPERTVRVKVAKGAPRKTRKEELLPVWLAAAGITRPVRWHDLRHTCASSLVAGWWGRAWSLEEIKEMLGHSSIVVTQMYAHLGETSLQKAARETSGNP